VKTLHAKGSAPYTRFVTFTVSSPLSDNLFESDITSISGPRTIDNPIPKNSHRFGPPDGNLYVLEFPLQQTGPAWITPSLRTVRKPAVCRSAELAL
jgi:hypothetical protein